MSEPEEGTTCFLCGDPAKCQKTDGHNRRLYDCSSQSCGEYEISLAAKERLKNPTDKAKVSAEVHCIKNQDPDKILVITVDPKTHDLDFKVVPRSEVYARISHP